MKECVTTESDKFRESVFEMVLKLFQELITRSELKESELLLQCLLRRDNMIKLLLQYVGDKLDPDQLYTFTWSDEDETRTTEETVFMRESKVQHGFLPLLCSFFKHRYNPNIQDRKGYTVLMHAVTNYSPDVIKELVEHPQIDLSLRNMYQQAIIIPLEKEG